MTTFTLNKMSGGVPVVDAESGVVFGESFVPLYVRDSFKLAGIAALQDEKPGLLFAPSEIVFINKVCALVKQDRDHAEGEASDEGLDYAPLEEIAVYSGSGVPLGRLSSITVNAATGDPLYFSVEPFPEGEAACAARMMPAKEPEEEPAECACEDKAEETCENAEPVCAGETCEAPAEEVCENETEETCECKTEECTCETEPVETCECRTEECVCENEPAECACEPEAEETFEAPEECACETETEETCKCQPEECTCEAEPEETCEVPAEEVCENEQPCECQPEECVCECETEECACEPEAEPADDPEEEEADSLPTIEWLLADKAAEKTSTGLSIDLSLREENAKFENALTREVPPAETSDEETPAAEGPAETHVEEVQAPDTAVEETVSAEVPAEEPDPLSYEAYYEDTTPEQFLRKLEGMLGPSAYERTEAPAPAPAVRDDIFEPDVLKAVTGDDLSSIDLDAANAVAQAFGAEIAKPAEALAKAEEPVIVSLAAGAEELARIYEEAEARARQAEEAASEAPAGETSEAPAEGPAPEEDVMLEDLLAGVPNIDVAEALSEVAIPEMFEETTEEAAEEPAETAPAGETDVEKAVSEAAPEAPAEEAAPAEETKAEAAAPAEVPAEETKPQSKEPSFRNTSAGDTENFNLNAPEDYYRPNINYSKQLQKRTGSQILGMVIFGGLCLLASLL